MKINRFLKQIPVVIAGLKSVAGKGIVFAMLGFALAACAGRPSQSEIIWGMGSYLLGPDLPTIFTFDRDSMSCSVSWGTLGAPGPGPFTDEHFQLDQVNFGMIVYSLGVESFTVEGNQVTMTGHARSITTVNDAIVEIATYEFTVKAVDGGSPVADSFSMTLYGEGLMFHDHTFEPVAEVRAGLTNGDIVIRP